MFPDSSLCYPMFFTCVGTFWAQNDKGALDNDWLVLLGLVEKTRSERPFLSILNTQEDPLSLPKY